MSGLLSIRFGLGEEDQIWYKANSILHVSSLCLFFYSTTLYMSLFQPTLLVSVSSTTKKKSKKQTVSAHSLEKKKEKSKKESVPKQLNRYIPSLYSTRFLPVHIFVTPVKQPSSRRPLRKNCYTFGAFQNLFWLKLSMCSSTH